MTLDVQTIINLVAVVWLVTVSLLFIPGIKRVTIVARDKDEQRPRRAVLEWVTNCASQISTGAALIAVAVYFISRWWDFAAGSLGIVGIIGVVVYYGTVILIVAFLPNISRYCEKREQAQENRKSE